MKTTATQSPAPSSWFPEPPGAELALTLVLPRATPSNNVIKGMHYRAYTALRNEFQALVKAALWSTGQQEAATLFKSWLRVERHAPSDGLDWDNAIGGLKPLLDCLVQSSPRNPSGLGLIADDNPGAMPFPPFVQQFKCKRGEDRTVLHVYRLPADATAATTNSRGAQE